MTEQILRFCVITTFYPPYNFGGDGINIHRLSNELARRGHHVDIIHCVDAFQMFKTGGVKGKYPNHPNVKVHKLKSKFGFLSPLATQLTGMPFFKGKKIKDLIERNRYDVIHYHNMSLIGIAAIRYGKAIKLYSTREHWLVCPMHVLWKFDKEVCTKRNCILCSIAGKKPPQFWRYTGLMERMLRHIDGFISPSRFTKNKHLELGLNIPIRHIPNFLPKIKEQDCDVKTRDLSNNKRPYFLFVGRLEKIKGLQNLIPVFKKHGTYDLFVAGDGKYGTVLKELAEKVINIKFLGGLNQESLSKLYKNAIAVIVPSICYEVFGVIIIESFAMKTPVIVNNLGGMPEIIEESGGGFIYSNNEELVSAMDKLAHNTNLRRELGNKGYHAYLKYWSEDAHIEKYLHYIKELKERRNNLNGAI